MHQIIAIIIEIKIPLKSMPRTSPKCIQFLHALYADGGEKEWEPTKEIEG
jgi:hypothetical protein